MAPKKNIRVPYGSTVHDKSEINSVIKVLNTSTQMGKNVETFENKIAKLFDKKYGLMTNSGTSALYLAMETLNLKEGSEIITPSLTFGTTVASIVKNKFIPVFVDVKLNTFCIDEDAIESKITKKTKAILAPDLLGNICNWNKIKKIAKKNNLMVLHDSADALGSKLNSKNVGFYSDLSITSFYGSHIINGAGNGGMVLTSNKKNYERMKVLRSWGRSSSLLKNSESISKRFEIKIDGMQYDKKFVFEELGYQLEPSEISAAFGLEQLKKLKKNINLRIKNFNSHIRFFNNFKDFLILPKQNNACKTAWLAFPLIVKENKYFNRTDLQIFLERKNIQTRVIFTGNILRQPGFKKIKCVGKASDFKVSDQIMKNGLLIGCHHGLNKDHLNHIYNSFNIFFKNKLKR